MRKITHIVLHCTATPQNTTVESIQRYWRTPKPKGNGWKSPGYHHIIKADGTIVDLLPIEQVSNGVAGNNSNSINISYIGGVDKKGKALDNRTDAQKAAQIALLKKYKAMFPGVVICGHRDFPKVRKSCPSFDVATWLKTVTL
jgi:N-acetylmuramoyl-L-alanine amidase